MNNEQANKKLAELSFDDLYVEARAEAKPKVTIGRMYAAIHRTSSRVPESLRVEQTHALQETVQPAETGYVIPNLSGNTVQQSWW